MTTRRTPARAAALLSAAALASTLLLGGCGGDTVPVARPEQQTVGATSGDGVPVGPQYVALGDSYAAAPGVPDTSGADGCFRSDGNYAQQVARATGLPVTDATCSGATTASVLEEQVPLITDETELVTLGVGGNDGDLFTTLLQRCLGLASSDPDGTPCSDAIRGDVEKVLPETEESIGRLLDAVVAAAPDARVVVVGYPDLLPRTGSCPDRVPLAAGDYPLLNEVTDRLSDLLREQAEARDLDFVDLAGPSRGHDICSDEPWVNGQDVAPDGTIPFHPFAAEQAAVARLVTALVEG